MREQRYEYMKEHDAGQLKTEITTLNLPGFLGLSGTSANPNWIGVSFIEPLSTAHKAILDAAVAFHTIDPSMSAKRLRAQAEAMLDDALDRAAMVDRAVVLASRLANNVLRARFRAESAAMAAATNLSDLKLRWATLPPMPDLTKQDVRDAVINQMNSGEADE